jgi:glycosyltransferase involved in cell wall biosynthesis
MSRRIRSIAMIDTDGGDGIGGYTYELSEGLAANGVHVDVYANSRSGMQELSLPRHHRLFPVLGGALFKQRRRAPVGGPAEVKSSKPASQTAASSGRADFRSRVRACVLPLELAWHLKRQGYDLVWIQFTEDAYGARFYALCKGFGIPVAHTVHNVLPHEEGVEDKAAFATLYQRANVLIVHSQWAAAALADVFPEVAGKTIVSRLGLYTMFKREPSMRKEGRALLRVPNDQPVLLFFGGIRPYKNIEAVLDAMRDTKLANTLLVVSGRESGYADSVPGDPLGRTRRLAEELGIVNRVRFLPGRLDLAQTTELLEASDVLLLPYRKSYGSALLLLGMTFGKHIVATTTGGMEEYLGSYRAHTLLAGSDSSHVADGIVRALAERRRQQDDPTLPPSHLTWPAISKDVLSHLDQRLFGG